MRVFFTFLLFFALFSNNFFAATTTSIPDSSDNKTYQRTTFVEVQEAKPGNLSPWKDTQGYLRRSIVGFDYVKRSGNLESKLFKFYNGEPLPKETVNGFEISIEGFFANKFIDSTKEHNLMYFDNFKAGYKLAYHKYSLADTIATQFEPYTVGFIDMGINVDYTRGYGWTFEDKASLSVYKTLGLTVGILALTDESTKDPVAPFGDYNETGFRYQINKTIGAVTGIRENQSYNGFTFDKWALSKIVEVSGNAVLDKLLTSYFVNKKDQWTPIYQLVYQSAWSYLFYALRQKNTYFPFSNTEGESMVQDTRFFIGLKFSFTNYL
ncbi:MAG: hypothetical protein HYZ54_01275 [Ignavibacteriae bacterium]|nr:hypothetical protein [Ignavibacteriota bacterium]